MRIVGDEDPAIVEASGCFDQAVEDTRAGRQEAAALHYLDGAKLLRRGEAHSEPDVLYNRRVAYANATNLRLSLRLIVESRGALLAAAEDDADLAEALRQAAEALPAPMRCAAP